MNLLEKTKMIQSKVGASPDGIYGNATADKLLALVGLSPVPVESGSLVKGTGVNIRRVFIHCSATREGQDIDEVAGDAGVAAGEFGHDADAGGVAKRAKQLGGARYRWIAHVTVLPDESRRGMRR